jgi:transcriptional regulator with XRE-family HTH domain
MLKLASDDDFKLLFISENLKRLRIAHDLTPAKVAAVIRKSRQGYVNYETGVREIGIHSLITLSGFYNVSIDEIVGNPFSLRNEKKLSFRTYELIGDEFRLVMPLTISTINEDIICVKHNDVKIDFFWRTHTHQKGRLMLFEYYNRAYVSKVFFNNDGGGAFFLHDEPLYFTKAHAENIVFKGVHASSLTKEFNILNYF